MAGGDRYRLAIEVRVGEVERVLAETLARSRVKRSVDVERAELRLGWWMARSAVPVGGLVVWTVADYGRDLLVKPSVGLVERLYPESDESVEADLAMVAAEKVGRAWHRDREGWREVFDQWVIEMKRSER